MVLLLTAQASGTVKGYVYGEDRSPLGGAVVVVYTLPDTGKAGGTYADDRGYFEITLKPGGYLMRVSFVGYEERTLRFNVNPGETTDLGTITLRQKAIRVEEVEVEAEAPKVTYEGEKKVIRFADEITSKGSSTLEALKNVPGVTVDNNDNVRIRNTSNITLLINGKPTVMQVSEALRQIPASSVERIEIITNPGAKYEAEGRVIMNIVLKKHHDEGTAASLMGRIGTFNNYGASLSVGINTRKLKFTFGGNYFVFAHYMDSRTNTSTPSFEFSSEGVRFYRMRPYGVRSSLEYRITQNDVLTFEGSFGFWNFAMGWNGKYDLDRETDASVDIGGKRLSAFTGYTKNFLKNHTLDVSLYYGLRGGNENTVNYMKDADGNVVYGFKRISSGPSGRWRGKLDYTWQYSKDRKIEAGYQGDLWNSYDTTRYYTYSSGDFVQDGPTLTSRYRRTTHAGYFSYSNRLGNFSYNLGLRVERTERATYVEDSVYTFKSTDPFPSIHLSYNLNVSNQISLSYSRRVWHPRHWMINPFMRVIDEFTRQKGNPDLKPEYTHSFEASYQRIFGRRGYAGVEVFYKRTDNNVEYIPTYEGTNILYTWLNAGYTTSSGVEVYATYHPWKLLTLNLSLDAYDHRVYLDSITRSLTYDAKGSITLGRGPIGLQLSGKYSGPRYVPGGVQRATYSFDIGLRVPLSRSIFVIAQFNDFLGTGKREVEITGEDFRQVSVHRRKWPSMSLMVMYDYNNFRRFRKPKKEREATPEEEVPQF